LHVLLNSPRPTIACSRPRYARCQLADLVLETFARRLSLGQPRGG